MMTPVEYAICRHCGFNISHGGTTLLDSIDIWWGPGDDFMCPDGEECHEPRERTAP